MCNHRLASFREKYHSMLAYSLPTSQSKIKNLSYKNEESGTYNRLTSACPVPTYLACKCSSWLLMLNLSLACHTHKPKIIITETLALGLQSWISLSHAPRTETVMQTETKYRKKEAINLHRESLTMSQPTSKCRNPAVETHERWSQTQQTRWRKTWTPVRLSAGCCKGLSAPGVTVHFLFDRVFFTEGSQQFVLMYAVCSQQPMGEWKLLILD